MQKSFKLCLPAKTDLLVWCRCWIVYHRNSVCCQMSNSQLHLLFGHLGSLKDWLEPKHGQWSGSKEHQPWKAWESKAPDRVGCELCAWQVPTLWTRSGQSSAVQWVASLPPWRQPAAYEGGSGLLAQQPHGWDSFPGILFKVNDAYCNQNIYEYTVYTYTVYIYIYIRNKRRTLYKPSLKYSSCLS